MNDKVLKEIQDRARRIETRLTKFMEQQGFDTGVARPWFHDGRVRIPSRASSIIDILGVIPAEWVEQEVEIFEQDELVAIIVPVTVANPIKL